jgi:hypothetical protein
MPLRVGIVPSGSAEFIFGKEGRLRGIIELIAGRLRSFGLLREDPEVTDCLFEL